MTKALSPTNSKQQAIDWSIPIPSVTRHYPQHPESLLRGLNHINKWQLRRAGTCMGAARLAKAGG